MNSFSKRSCAGLLILVATCLMPSMINSSAFAAPQTGAKAADVPPIIQLDALNSMTDALGPMVGDAESRIKLMNAFMSEKGIEDDSSSSTDDSNFTELTFDQAYEQAVKDQASRGKSTSNAGDADTVKAEVSATRTMVKDQWNRLNGLHRKVAGMTEVLRKNKMFDDYQKWAVSDAAKNLKPEGHSTPSDRKSESSKITPEQRAENIKKYQAHLSTLRNHWDHYHFTFSTTPKEEAMPGGALGNANNNENSDTYTNPGVNSSDYYSGNYWNGYADPYYDLYGYPGMYGPDAWRRNGLHRAYHRAENNHPNVAPSHNHPSMRGGGGRRR